MFYPIFATVKGTAIEEQLVACMNSTGLELSNNLFPLLPYHSKQM